MTRRLTSFLDAPWFVPACLAAAFLVRLLWMLLVDPKPISDFDWYYTQGIHILEGRGYQIAGAPTAYWPVGYSAFLAGLFAVFGASVTISQVANLVLDMGVLVLGYVLARDLFKSERTARLTLLILAFHPNHIAYVSLVASEILFTFLMLLGIWLLMKRGWLMAALAGVVFGVVFHVRPQLFGIPVLAWLLIPNERSARWSERLSQIGIVYGIIVLVLIPWTIRNYRAFGHIVLVSTSSGGNLVVGNSPWATGAYVESPELEKVRGPGNEWQRDHNAKKYALEYIRTHPVETLKLLPLKFYYLYRGDVEGIRWSLDGIRADGRSMPEAAATGLVVVAEAYYLAMAVACLACLVLALRSDLFPRGFSTLGLGMIAYFTLLGLVFYGGGRYHFPAMPFVAMYAAALPELVAKGRT